MNRARKLPFRGSALSPVTHCLLLLFSDISVTHSKCSVIYFSISFIISCRSMYEISLPYDEMCEQNHFHLKPHNFGIHLEMNTYNFETFFFFFLGMVNGHVTTTFGSL